MCQRWSRQESSAPSVVPLGEGRQWASVATGCAAGPCMGTRGARAGLASRCLTTGRIRVEVLEPEVFGSLQAERRLLLDKAFGARSRGSRPWAPLA